MPSLDMLIGDSAEASLVDYFGHPCRIELSYTASAPDSVVTVSISETKLMTVAVGVAEDSVPVRVMATDTTDKFAVHVFYVSVEQPNRAPLATGSIADVTVSPGRVQPAGSISDNFYDPDGDVLLFHDPPESADPAIAFASVTRTGDEFNVFGGDTLGSTTITITVSDPEGLTASHDVTVHNVAEGGG